MQLNEIWIWYCLERLGLSGEQPPPTEPLTAAKALRLLFEVHPMFRARHEAIAATPYAEAFDGEADAALASLARYDDFLSWDGLSAGAWRVLYERLVHSETVIILNELRGRAMIGRLPTGLDEQSKVRAVLLQFLLGGGRTIDRRLLPRSEPGAAPAFPSAQTLRRQ